jgi:hypothetical protein
VVIVIDSSGKFWDGFGWNVQGKEFFSIPAATRSLHEHGEDAEDKLFLVSDTFLENHESAA